MYPSVSQPVSAPASTADRILALLKAQGPLSAAELGKALEVTGEAARQQLHRLARHGLVASSSQAQGVGRPVKVWQLTPDGHRRFPDKHAGLLVQVLEHVQDALGDAALEQIIAARESQTRRSYLDVLGQARTLEERVTLLARTRTNEGYMCEARPVDAHTWFLVENHCPIGAAARQCRQLCQSELHLFRSVLGDDVQIERTEHIQSGGQRCTYRISVS